MGIFENDTSPYEEIPCPAQPPFSFFTTLTVGILQQAASCLMNCSCLWGALSKQTEPMIAGRRPTSIKSAPSLPQRVHPHLTHSVSPGVTIQTVTRTCSFNSHACETMSNHLGLGFSSGQCDRNSLARLFQECVVHNAFYPAMLFYTFNIPRRKRDASEWTVYG